MLHRHAIISKCEHYRYSLLRIWDAKLRRLCLIMLNPSTADGYIDDPTIKACYAFATSWGFGSFEIGNLFAYRTKSPAVLKTLTHQIAIGPATNAHLILMTKSADQVVLAWGRHGALHGRDKEVLALIRRQGIEPLFLARPEADYPQHPLYLPRDLEPRPYH